MADRTWNGVDARLYKEFRISKPARLVLAYVIANCPNQYGIYDPSPEFDAVDWFDGIFPRMQAQAAFEELTVARPRIAMRFRDGTCLWVVRKFARELESGAVANSNYLTGIARYLDKYPDLKPEFLGEYGTPLANIAKGFPGFVNPFPILGNNGSYPEPDPEPILILSPEREAKASLPAASASGRRTKVNQKPAAPKWPADTDWEKALEVAVSKLSEPAKVSFKAWVDAVNYRRVKGLALAVPTRWLHEILISAKHEGLSMASLDHAFLQAAKAVPPAEKVNYVLVAARNWAKRQGPTDWDGNAVPLAEQHEDAERREQSRIFAEEMAEEHAHWQRRLTGLAEQGITPPGLVMPDDALRAWIHKQEQALGGAQEST